MSKQNYLVYLMLLIVLGISQVSKALPNQPLITQTQNTSQQEQITERLLYLINQERRSAGLRPVELDPFASKVAENHCQEMLNNSFTSHWNQAGLKPYMRYALAGGADAVMENVAGRWSNSGIDLAHVSEIAEQLHLAMFNERAPNDSHRQTILAPQHTHVGLAVRANGNSLRLDEEFVARYLIVQPTPNQVKAGSSITLTGELLYENMELYNIEIFYEPFPKPMDIETLNHTSLYSFPKDHLVLRPILPTGYSYSDGTSGIITADKNSGKFSCPISFREAQPGLYTIVVIISHEGRRFPATNICVAVK